MFSQPLKQFSAFVSFSHLSFGLSALMVSGGVFFMPIDHWMKGFLDVFSKPAGALTDR